MKDMIARSRLDGIGTKIILTLGSLLVALIPLWFFLLVENLLSPEGFWQNFVVYGLGIYFLGIIQLVFLIIWIGSLIEVVWD